MMTDKVAIIAVTFNPDINDLTHNIFSYVNQTTLIIIVDNSTDIIVQNMITEEFKKYENIIVLTLGNNYGIAKAQNIGFQYAIDNGYDYFIEMDEDSQLPNYYVENIYNSYLDIISLDKSVAGIGPIAVNKKDNSSYHDRDTSDKIIEVEKTLSSGFFTSRKALEKIGFKDENLFIDLVDWEWCWRAKSKGYKVFVDTQLKIPHLLGDGHKNFYFFKIGIPSPVRHYYQYRNSLLLLSKPYVPFQWKIKRLLIHSIKPLFFIIFYDKKLKRLKYIFKGIQDAISKKSGKII